MGRILRVLWFALLLGCGASRADAVDLVWASGSDVTGANALDATSGTSRAMADHNSEGLTRLVHGKLTPWLASSWRIIDDHTWEFSLRPNVKFHNGEPFTAESVKATFAAITDKNNRSPFRTDFTIAREIQVVDDLTVRIVTIDPQPLMPLILFRLNMIPPKYFASVGAAGYRRHPVGTGAYRFVEFVRDDHITMEAFKDYWGGPQHFQRITHRPILEPAARVAALLTGEIDFAAEVPSELESMFAGRRDIRLIKKPNGRVLYLNLNNKRPSYPTNKREVREALSYSIDREALASELLPGIGRASVWQTWGTLGEDPDAKPLPYDPQRSRALLAQAGYPNGLDIVMDVPTNRYMKDRDIANAMVAQMKEAGFRVTLRTAEWGAYMQRIYAADTAPLSMFSFDGGTFDPHQFNRSYLFSDGMYSQVQFKEFDELLKRIEAEMNPDKRRALIVEQRKLQDRLIPFVYIVQLGIIGAVNDKLKDWDMQADERYSWVRNSITIPRDASR